MGESRIVYVESICTSTEVMQFRSSCTVDRYNNADRCLKDTAIKPICDTALDGVSMTLYLYCICTVLLLIMDEFW